MVGKIDVGRAPDGILEMDNDLILQEFELALRSSGASDGTVKSYISAVKDFLRFINNKPLREVTLRDVMSWRNEKARRGFGKSRGRDPVKWATTLHYYTIFVRRFLEWLGLGLRVPSYRKSPRRIEILTNDEVARLFNACRRADERLILRLLLETGLRSRELLGLRAVDVDFQNKVIRIREAKYGKERYVTAPQGTFAMLRSWIEVNGLGPEDPLFKLSYEGLYKKLKRLARRAGVDPRKVRPHVLRHTFATLALRRGMSLPSLQALLGHSDIKTTQVYLHLSIEDIKREYEEKFELINSCPRCGKGVPPNSAFCPHCGAPLSAKGEAMATGLSQ